MTDKKESKQQVFVLGMHRSGTSYLSRALNLCGLYLGPVSDFYDDELHPIIGNPRGHWENKKVIAINESILNINTGSWENIPSSLSELPDELTKKMSKLRESFYLHNAIAYGFKDPRLTITLDKWLSQFPQFVIVGIFRHPLKVAESLKMRNGFEYQKSLKLWKVYNQKLLQILKTHNGFLIDFDWDSDKLLEETKMIAKKIGLFKVDLSYWFKEDLKKSDKTFDNSYSLSDDLIDLYKKLQNFSLKNQQVQCTAPQISSNQYENIVKDLLVTSNLTYDGIVRVAHNELHILRTEVGSLTNKIKHYEEEIAKYPSEIKQYENQLEEYQNKIKHYEEEIAKYPSEIKQYENQLEEYQNKIKHYEEEIAKYPTNMKHYQEEIRRHQNEIERYQEEIAKYPTDIERYQNEIERYQEEIAKLQGGLEEYAHEIHLIKSSTIFKSITFFTSKIDKVFGKKKLGSGIKPTITASKKIIETEGIGPFLYYAKEKVKKREYTVSPQNYDLISKPSTIQNNVKPDSAEQTSIASHPYVISSVIDYEKKFDIFVIIDPSSDYSRVLIEDKINSQNGIQHYKTITKNEIKTNFVLDSIPKDFIITLNNDSLPISDDLFYDLCSSFDEDDVGLVISRVIPKSDSSMFYCFLLDKDSSFIDENSKEKFYIDHVETIVKNPFLVSNNVCFCIKKDILQKCNIDSLNNNIHEIIKKILAKKYKIVYLCSNGVIHSQNYDSSLCFKKGFVDSLSIKRNLDLQVDDFTSKGISNTSKIIEHIWVLYNALNFTITELSSLEYDNVDDYFKAIEQTLAKSNVSPNISSFDQPLHDTLTALLISSNEKIDTSSYLLPVYLLELKKFEKFLNKTCYNMSDIQKEFFFTLFKIFGYVIGNELGNYYHYCTIKNINNSKLIKLKNLVDY